MSAPATLYRFRLSVSDVARSFYEDLDVRIPMHPSETEPYLLTRVLAYALNYEPLLELSNGLSSNDEPALRVPDPNGGFKLWIDVGSPSARRLHKASKAARSVKVYTYKDPRNLIAEVAAETVYKASEIQLYSLAPSFLDSLAALLQRDNRWSIFHNDGELVISVGDATLSGSLESHRLG